MHAYAKLIAVSADDFNVASGCLDSHVRAGWNLNRRQTSRARKGSPESGQMDFDAGEFVAEPVPENECREHQRQKNQ